MMYKLRSWSVCMVAVSTLGFSLLTSPLSAGKNMGPTVGLPAATGLGAFHQVLNLIGADVSEFDNEIRVASSKFEKRTISAGGMSREYFYYIPYGADLNKPLVIGLHGGGGLADDFGDRMNLQSIADQYGFALVLPQGVGRDSSNFNWNAESITGLSYAEKNDIPDVAFVEAMLDDMKTVTTYNSDRVFAAGMSKGGMMAYHLACAIPDKLAAIAVVAGTFSSADCAGGDVSLLHIHGTDDENVPWEGGAGSLSRAGANWPAVSRGIDLFMTINECSSNKVSEQVVEDTVCDVRQCAGGDTLEICTVLGGGHAWPGIKAAPWQKQNGVYVSQKFDATAHIGAFFAQH